MEAECAGVKRASSPQQRGDEPSRPHLGRTSTASRPHLGRSRGAPCGLERRDQGAGPREQGPGMVPAPARAWGGEVGGVG